MTDFRDTVTVDTLHGRLTVMTDDVDISASLIAFGSCGHSIVTDTLELLRLPRGEGTVVDVGAHIGYVSIGMLLDGWFERAIAIEPEPRNFGLLVQNVEQNGLAGRFELVNAAASDKNGLEVLEMAFQNKGDHRVRREPYHQPAALKELERKTVEVSSVTLDSVVEDAALVWMDVQGFDGYAIKGGARLFSKGVPLVDEIWPYGIRRSGMSLQEYWGLMSSHFASFTRLVSGARAGIEHFGNFLNELDAENGFADVLLLPKGWE